MSGFFRTQSKPKKFSVGIICKVDVPEDYKQSHGAFQDAKVRIVSKREFLAKYVMENKIERNKVICKILEAPNAVKNVKVIGLEYPIRRSWLQVDGHKCTCSLKDTLMITGCVCGGY
jgi:hypothetical protein